jgi:DNA-binding transcriptional LysR family regulator
MMRATPVTSQMTGSINIGTVPGASFLLPVSIKILIKTYRQLKLRVTSNLKYELTDKIKNGKLDIALLTVDGEVDQDLTVRHILTEPLVVLAPLEQYGKSDVELLSQNSYISFNRKASVSGMIEAEFQRLKLEVDVVMELDTIETLHTMILEGLGVCILPLSAVRPYLKNKLYMVPFSPTRVRRTIGLVQKKNHHRQALLDKVYDVVASSAKKYESMTPLKISDR